VKGIDPEDKKGFARVMCNLIYGRCYNQIQRDMRTGRNKPQAKASSLSVMTAASSRKVNPWPSCVLVFSLLTYIRELLPPQSLPPAGISKTNFLPPSISILLAGLLGQWPLRNPTPNPHPGRPAQKLITAGYRSGYVRSSTTRSPPCP